MPTDEERRKVAARLREQKTWDICTGFEYCIGDICDAVFVDKGDLNDMFRLQTALAELIEPEPRRTTRLELVATEVDKNGDALAVGVHCALCGLLDEEVVGADPDNWMLWRYCPSCGAEVVS